MKRGATPQSTQESFDLMPAPGGSVAVHSNEHILLDVAEASGFLALGDSTDGLSAAALTAMRERLLHDVTELARRWGMSA